MTSTTAPAVAHPPLVITGMHRSGTSLAASLVAGAGIDVGRRLMAASRGNERGHYEDLDFYEFHARALRAHGAGAEGFACVDGLAVPTSLRPAAEALVEAKSQAGVPWGWKDPRTCLFLDFWGDLLPDARFLFVFRSPWEVMDSLFRRGDEVFAANPAHAARVWLDYNRRIVDFLRRHRSRCLLVEVGQLTADPAGVFAAIRSRLVMPVGEPPARFERELLVRDDSAARAALVEAMLPEAIELYAEMRRLAGLPERIVPTSGGGSSAVAEQAIAEWARGAAAVERLKQVEAERDAADAARLKAEETLAATARETESRIATAVAAATTEAANRFAAVEARLLATEGQARAAEGRIRELIEVRRELSAQLERVVFAHDATEHEPPAAEVPVADRCST